MIKEYDNSTALPEERISVESNATPTLHQGVELSLDTPLYASQQGELRLRQAYTLSDFQYKTILYLAKPVAGNSKTPLSGAAQLCLK